MVSVRQLITKMVSGLTSNDLTSLKKYLDSDESTIADDATSIEYSYSVSPQIYRQDADGSVHQVNPDSTLSMLGLGSSGSGSTSVTTSLMNSVGSNTSVSISCPPTVTFISPSTKSRPAAGPKSLPNVSPC